MASVYRNVFGMTTAVSAALLMASMAGAQVSNPEVEPNESKATATVAASGGAGMVAGDFITGTTTGTSITAGAGLASADYFRVKTAAMPLGIYRHRLQLTSTTLGQTGTIRGLSATANSATGGSINVTSDAIFQTAPTTLTNGVPIRTNQWYGFGKQEEIYYRVAGVASTTGVYTSTLSTFAVTPVSMGNVLEGNVTVAKAAGNTADLDFWVYNSNLDPIANFGKDSPQPESATMALVPGVYYIMAGNVNSANNQAPPIGETASGNVLDFANAAANSSTTAPINLAMTVTLVLWSLYGGQTVYQDERPAKSLPDEGRRFLIERMVETFAGQVAETPAAAESIERSLRRVFSRAPLENRDARAWHLMLRALGSQMSPSELGLEINSKNARREELLRRRKRLLEEELEARAGNDTESESATDRPEAASD